jgi:hypothetical protein
LKDMDEPGSNNIDDFVSMFCSLFNCRVWLSKLHNTVIRHINRPFDIECMQEENI